MAFYCREDELRKMNRRFTDDKFECIVIYGDYVKIGLNQEKPYK